MSDKQLGSNFDFVGSELRVLDYWQAIDAFGKLKAKNAGGKKYRFIDGPITANGSMGVHHLWGRTLKDIFLRFKASQGYDSHYRNGFDGQGLWIEVVVEKELGFAGKQDIEAYGLERFADACIARVDKSAAMMTRQSQRLGQWMDWQNSYFTNADTNITAIWAFLKKCHDQKMIERDARPRVWCTRCGTSLSDHEMAGSYADLEHEAVVVKAHLADGRRMLVWTTTPWTLAANVALAVHPELEYTEYRVTSTNERLICSSHFFGEKFAKRADCEVVGRFAGAALVGLEYQPILDLPVQQFCHRVVAWTDVSETEGVGVVHIAPGCGEEDFELGKSASLRILNPISDEGVYTAEYGFLAGCKPDEVAQRVFEALRATDRLLYTHKLKHSYPICWRCKTPVITRLASDWVIRVDKIRPKLIKNAMATEWNPPHEQKRMLDWLTNMGDWSISRRRFYGLPLPIYPCECGELTVIGSLDQLRAQATQPDLVDQMPHIHRPWIDKIQIKCPCCGRAVSRIPEVGDVWMDAGIVPFSTLRYFDDPSYWAQYFPAEYVVEMKEQIRLWFYALLFMSTVMVGKSPYKKVGTYGMVTDQDGQRFSKTRYMINVDDAFQSMGADAIRYVFAATPPTSDVRFGEKPASEARRKLLAFYNMVVFFDTYAHIDQPKVSFARLAKLTDITDRWLLVKTDQFVRTALAAFEQYSTREVIKEFEELVDQVSNFYIRVNRRRFWKDGSDADKLNAYSVLMYCLKSVIRVMAPIVPFMSEALWLDFVAKYLPCQPSVHLEPLPKPKKLSDVGVVTTASVARQIISLGLKLRNERNIKIKQPLKTLFVSGFEGADAIVSAMEAIIKSELNVKQIEIVDVDQLEERELALDFRKAGAYFKSNVNNAKLALSQLDIETKRRLVGDFVAGRPISFAQFEGVPCEMFVITAKPSENMGVARENGIAVALDLSIDSSLMDEYIVRELVRQCQVWRKQSSFRVDNRIQLSIQASDPETQAIFQRFADQIRAELLAVNLVFQPPCFQHTYKLTLDTTEIAVSMQASE